MSNREEKTTLRNRIKQALREADLTQLAQADQAAVLRVLALPPFQQAQTILSYAPFGREFNADLLNQAILDQGKTLALPLVTGPGQMEARLVESLSQLVPGAYGIREPGPDTPILPPASIDLLLLPGLAFDPACYRMGRGGGYYDRYLARFTGYTIAPTRELQIVPAVPRDPWDRRADLVVTEKRVLRPTEDSPSRANGNG